MWLWIVLVVLAVMAALLIYAACCVDGDIDRQSEAHPPKSEKGRDDPDAERPEGAGSGSRHE